MLQNAELALIEMKYRQAKLLQEARMMQLASQAKHNVVENFRRVSAYVFVSCAQPKRIASALSRLPGVVKADALLGAREAQGVVVGHSHLVANLVLVVEQRNFESLQNFLTAVQSTPGVKKVSVKLAA